MKKYVRATSFSQQTILDISEALINEEGDNKAAQYSLKTHEEKDTVPLELWRDDQRIRTIYLVPDVTNRQFTLKTMEIINAQAELLFREESTYGVKDPAGVQRILGAVTNGYGDQEFYPGVIKKATAYWYKYATTQMFHNGNKRTALLSGLYYLISGW
jgi:hypothetical protein